MDWAIVISRNHALLLRIVAELFAMARVVEGGTSPTLPRHLYNAILLILRPAESAIRRLIIIAARGLVLKPRASRPIPSGLASLASASLTRAPAFPLIDKLKPFGPDVWDQNIDAASLVQSADVTIRCSHGNAHSPQKRRLIQPCCSIAFAPCVLRSMTSRARLAASRAGRRGRIWHSRTKLHFVRCACRPFALARRPATAARICIRSMRC